MCFSEPPQSCEKNATSKNAHSNITPSALKKYSVFLMCFLTVSSRPCLETNPHSILRTPFAGHCLGGLRGGKPCPVELCEGVNRTVSFEPCLETLPANSPDTICWTLCRYEWFYFLFWFVFLFSWLVLLLDIDSAKTWCIAKKWVVYKLHAEWFINRTAGEFINRSLFIQFKGLLRGIPTDRGEMLILNFWPQGSL